MIDELIGEAVHGEGDRERADGPSRRVEHRGGDATDVRACLVTGGREAAARISVNWSRRIAASTTVHGVRASSDPLRTASVSASGITASTALPAADACSGRAVPGGGPT